MLILTLFACTTSPVRPKWVSACSVTGPTVTCVNADSVTYAKDDDNVICHWDCAEIGGDEDSPDSGPGLETYSTGLDSVFEPDAEGVCYTVHAHRYDEDCP